VGKQWVNYGQATMSKSGNPFKEYIDLAQPRLGSEVVYASDDFFAAKERMIDPAAPVFIDGKFDDNGKWMDGWESRRKRGPGHDYSIIRFGVPGKIAGVDIDTTHFTGNYPPAASLQACVSNQTVPQDSAWVSVHDSLKLEGNSHHYLEIADDQVYTHLRLNIYPDGGIARLRVYGTVQPSPETLQTSGLIDLLAMENGGRALICNDEHFGSMHNLNAPGRGINMGDGWETARRRVPGNDWVVLALGQVGIVEKIEIDTAHFKGNYPDRVSIQAAYVSGGVAESIATQSLYWDSLLAEQKLQMDKQHYFTELNTDMGVITHIRVNIFPDGGISRVRLHGRIQGKTS
jgi:allantoicase